MFESLCPELSLFDTHVNGINYLQPSRDWLIASSEATPWMRTLEHSYPGAYLAMERVLYNGALYQAYGVIGSLGDCIVTPDGPATNRWVDTMIASYAVPHFAMYCIS